MIAKLRGTVDAISDGNCVIDVAGVGYLVFCSTRTLTTLPPSGATTLLIETQVREDAISLYGFASPAERDWFRLLTTVQGVGAKVALGILSALSPSDLIAAIARQDKAALTRAPAMPGGNAGAILATIAAPSGHVADALSALTNLGYRRPEAEAALARVVEDQGPAADLDILIRGALKALAK